MFTTCTLNSLFVNKGKFIILLPYKITEKYTLLILSIPKKKRTSVRTKDTTTIPYSLKERLTRIFSIDSRYSGQIPNVD